MKHDVDMVTRNRRRRAAMLARHNKRTREVLHASRFDGMEWNEWRKLRDWLYDGQEWIRHRDKTEK